MTDFIIGFGTILTLVLLVVGYLKLTVWKKLTKLEKGETRCAECGEPIGRGCKCGYARKPTKFFVPFDLREAANSFGINLILPVAWIVPVLVAPYSINSNKVFGFLIIASIYLFGILGIMTEGDLDDFFLDLLNDPYRKN